MKITYYVAMIYQYQATLQNLHDVLGDLQNCEDILEGAPTAEEVEKDLLYIGDEMLKVTGIVKEIDELIEDLMETVDKGERKEIKKDLTKLKEELGMLPQKRRKFAHRRDRAKEFYDNPDKAKLRKDRVLRQRYKKLVEE